MKHIEVNTGDSLLNAGVIYFFQKIITKFSTGAKIDCPKEYIGKNGYIVVRDD